MAVINTNISALIAQQNLTRSQGSLQTAMERLSSGLRINSAADDAAGQAIANRMTAQISGLGQAQRNANDGISIAQTTEGALNKINDNLQRIRKLSVQAANGSNSSSDLQSIQDEIHQRLDEINRVSKQTSFNSRNVLDKDQTLSIQVGANDGEVISIQLNQINSTTLGLDNLDVSTAFALKDGKGNDVLTAHQTLQSETVVASVGGDGATLVSAISPSWTSMTVTATGASGYSAFGAVIATNGLAVQSSGGDWYSASFNVSTGEITVGASLTAGSVNASATYFDPGTGSGGVIDIDEASVSNIKADSFAYSTIYMTNNTSTHSTLFYVSAKVGASTVYYAASLDYSTGKLTVDLATGSTTLTNLDHIDGSGVSATQSAVNAVVGQAAVKIDLSAVDAVLSTGTNTLVQTDNGDYYIQNNNGGSLTYYEVSTVNSASGSVTLKMDGSDPVVAENIQEGSMSQVSTKLSSGTNTLMTDGDNVYIQHVENGSTVFYAASISAGGTVTLNSNGSGGLVEVSTATTFDMSQVNSALSGDNTLMTRQVGGETVYYVQNGSGSAATYYQASVSAGAVTLGDQVQVDPLAALDNALKDVDELRSGLGAIQNRFESAIDNLGTTNNNLSAARSRIQDADYAKEVSDMTRAQILQQAGTSVLAQANQIPQIALSLLR